MTPHILLLFSILTLLLQPLAGQKLRFQQKIEIRQDTVLCLATLDSVFATGFYLDKDSVMTDKDQFIFRVAISDLFNYKIKYAPYQNDIVGFSLWRTGIKIDDRPVRQSRPTFVKIPLSDLQEETPSQVAHYLENRFSTNPLIDYLAAFDREIMNSYLGYRSNLLPDDLYHDFASFEDQLYFAYFSENNFFLCSGKISFSPKGFPVYKVNYVGSHSIKKEDFNLFVLKDSIYVFLRSGDIYLVKDKPIKIGTLDDVSENTIFICDYDKQEFYSVKEQYLHQNMPFSQIVKKYAQKIRLDQKN